LSVLWVAYARKTSVFGFKLCWLLNTYWRFGRRRCLHLTLYSELGATMLVRNVRDVWQQTCNIPVKASSDTGNLRREPAATSRSEASGSPSIHAVAGEFKLLEQDCVRNVDLQYC
jgi:hypothetical protein